MAQYSEGKKSILKLTVSSHPPLPRTTYNDFVSTIGHYYYIYADYDHISTFFIAKLCCYSYY